MGECPIIILTAILSSIFVYVITTLFTLAKASKRNLPPSPPKLPIIGNLHQVGKLLHRDLHSLAAKHGPIMLLHFARTPFLIMSSAEMAREIMKTHDLIFASRPLYKPFKKLVYEGKDVAAAVYGEEWRKMKSILVLQMLSTKRVQASRPIREQETAVLVEKIRESSSAPVNLSAMFVEMANDAVCRSTFGKKYSDSENGKKFLLLLSDFMELLISIDVGDFIPWLGWVSRVNGFDERLDRVAKEMDQVLENVIQERVEARNGEDFCGENFVDLMLQIYDANNHDLSIDRRSIKPLILDVFVGGTDTVSTALEWTMTELLRHPTMMEKLQHEVRGVVKQKQDISDDDMKQMHYLKAVIKESLRYHPPVPLLAPRTTSKDVKIKGYDVAAGTVVIVSAWAIGRDPSSYDEPEKFKPERFLNSSTDFKGLDFELIPFGAGRRGCPGITFAIAAIEFVIANLVHKFDWKLPPKEVDGKYIDMSESCGITVHKALPLLAVAMNRQQL